MTTKFIVDHSSSKRIFVIIPTKFLWEKYKDVLNMVVPSFLKILFLFYLLEILSKMFFVKVFTAQASC